MALEPVPGGDDADGLVGGDGHGHIGRRCGIDVDDVGARRSEVGAQEGGDVVLVFDDEHRLGGLEA